MESQVVNQDQELRAAAQWSRFAHSSDSCALPTHSFSLRTHRHRHFWWTIPLSWKTFFIVLLYLIEMEEDRMKVANRSSDEDLIYQNSCECPWLFLLFCFTQDNFRYTACGFKQEVDVSYTGSERGQEKVAEEITLQRTLQICIVLLPIIRVLL